MPYRPQVRAAALLSVALLAVVATAPPLRAQPAPVERTGDWSRAEPAAKGLDPEAVAAGVRALGAMTGVRCLLVVAGGELVVEEGFGGADPAALHNLKSASKSLLSLLTGIALERGDLPGLDAPLAELLGRELGGGRETIRLRHLLTMTSGLASTSGAGYGAWVAADDWTTAALAQPLLSPPGETFRYSTGNSHLLAAVLERATGEDLLDVARRTLFAPLGVGRVSWQESPEGVRFGGNNLSMAPRDLARVGLMLLNGGSWNGERVVPEGWIRQATASHAVPPQDWAERYGEYGYLWWLPRDHDGAYAAVGYGGQFLYVAPAAGVAVVLTSTLESKGADWDRRVLEIFRRQFAG